MKLKSRELKIKKTPGLKMKVMTDNQKQIFV
jgi:hypothetical protein